MNFKIYYTHLVFSIILFLNFNRFNAQSTTNKINWPGIKAEIRSTFPKVKHLTIDAFKKMVDRQTEMVLIDVRLNNEYKISHISNAHHLTNALQISAGYPDKKTKIICYCSVGYRSAAIAHTLNHMEGIPFDLKENECHISGECVYDRAIQNYIQPLIVSL